MLNEPIFTVAGYSDLGAIAHYLGPLAVKCKAVQPGAFLYAWGAKTRDRIEKIDLWVDDLGVSGSEKVKGNTLKCFRKKLGLGLPHIVLFIA